MQVGQEVLMTKKSTSWGAFFLGNVLVYWLSKKQTSTSPSTTKAKYIVVATCCTQVLWMKQTLKDMKVEYDQSILIIYDNTSAINKESCYALKDETYSHQVPLPKRICSRIKCQVGIHCHQGMGCRYFYQTVRF